MPCEIHRLALAALTAFALAGLAACQPTFNTLHAQTTTEVQPAQVAALATGVARTRAVRLERVVDGDTIVVRDRSGKRLRIRLAGIDAPELKQTGGQAAKKFLQAELRGEDLLIRSSKKDRYGRLVATVMAGRQDANLALLKAGKAWFYRRYRKEQPAAQSQAYEQAEQRARSARRGLWADDDPEAPWDYRSRKRKRRQGSGTSS